MDYHDGKYGINTDANRGADTFIPFNSLDLGDENLITFQATCWGNVVDKTYTATKPTRLLVFVSDAGATQDQITANITTDGTIEQQKTYTYQVNHKARAMIYIVSLSIGQYVRYQAGSFTGGYNGGSALAIEL